ncbi:MAG: hypothetical protein PVJ67_02075 [Candidatus Pacearchaeota archaeon]|jgi:hypothetical protein
MKRLILILFLILFFSVITAEEVSISRDLSNLKVNETFEVVLEINVSGNLLAVGIEEYAPENATIINSSAENFRINKSKIEFLLFDFNDSVQSQNISYFVLLNSSNTNFTENHEVMIIGEPTDNPSEEDNLEPSGGSSSGSGGSTSTNSGENQTQNDSLANNITILNNINNLGLEEGQIEETVKEVSKKMFNKNNFVYIGVLLFIGVFFFISNLKKS